MSNCCVLVCFRPATYKRLVNNLYPEDAIGNESDLKANNLDTLKTYAARYPKKLPLIGSYIEKRIKSDAKKEKYGFVFIAIQALKALVSGCSEVSTLDLFEPYIIRNIQTLLAIDNLCVKKSAVEAFSLFAAERSKSPTHLISTECFAETLESLCVHCSEKGDLGQETSIRLSGLRGISALGHLILRVNPPSLQIQLERIVEALLHNLAYLDGTSSANKKKLGKSRSSHLDNIRGRDCHENAREAKEEEQFWTSREQAQLSSEVSFGESSFNPLAPSSPHFMGEQKVPETEEEAQAEQVQLTAQNYLRELVCCARLNGRRAIVQAVLAQLDMRDWQPPNLVLQALFCLTGEHSAQPGFYSPYSSMKSNKADSVKSFSAHAGLQKDNWHSSVLIQALVRHLKQVKCKYEFKDQTLDDTVASQLGNGCAPKKSHKRARANVTSPLAQSILKHPTVNFQAVLLKQRIVEALEALVAAGGPQAGKDGIGSLHRVDLDPLLEEAAAGLVGEVSMVGWERLQAQQKCGNGPNSHMQLATVSHLGQLLEALQQSVYTLGRRLPSLLERVYLADSILRHLREEEKAQLRDSVGPHHDSSYNNGLRNKQSHTSFALGTSSMCSVDFEGWGESKDEESGQKVLMFGSDTDFLSYQRQSVLSCVLLVIRSQGPVESGVGLPDRFVDFLCDLILDASYEVLQEVRKVLQAALYWAVSDPVLHNNGSVGPFDYNYHLGCNQIYSMYDNDDGNLNEEKLQVDEKDQPRDIIDHQKLLKKEWSRWAVLSACQLKKLRRSVYQSVVVMCMGLDQSSACTNSLGFAVRICEGVHLLSSLVLARGCQELELGIPWALALQDFAQLLMMKHKYQQQEALQGATAEDKEFTAASFLMRTVSTPVEITVSDWDCGLAIRLGLCAYMIFVAKVLGLVALEAYAKDVATNLESARLERCGPALISLDSLGRAVPEPSDSCSESVLKFLDGRAESSTVVAKDKKASAVGQQEIVSSEVFELEKVETILAAASLSLIFEDFEKADVPLGKEARKMLEKSEQQASSDSDISECCSFGNISTTEPDYASVHNSHFSKENLQRTRPSLSGLNDDETYFSLCDQVVCEEEILPEFENNSLPQLNSTSPVGQDSSNLRFAGSGYIIDLEGVGVDSCFVQGIPCI